MMILSEGSSCISIWKMGGGLSPGLFLAHV